MVTAEQMHQALRIVREASAKFVETGFFKPGVLARFTQWLERLPVEREELAKAIVHVAAQWDSGTGADINGVALDEKREASLESMVLYYSALEPGLFPEPGVAAVRAKLSAHDGPLYAGPWP